MKIVMRKIVLGALWGAVGLTVAGCGGLAVNSTRSDSAEGDSTAGGRLPARAPSDIRSMFAQLEAVKKELRLLRNMAEELQFDTGNTQRRQRDLFDDLDRRLIAMERNGGTRVGGDTISGLAGTATGLQGGEAAGLGTNLATDATRAAAGAATAASTPSVSTAATQTATPSVSLEQQNAYDQAFNMLKQSRYEDAISGFQQFTATWEQSQLTDDAYYWMAEAHYVNRNFGEALDGFLVVVSKYPNSPRVPESLLKIGYVQYDLKTYEEAAATFRDVIDRFPNHQVTAQAKTRLRRIEQTILNDG